MRGPHWRAPRGKVSGLTHSWVPLAWGPLTEKGCDSLDMVSGTSQAYVIASQLTFVCQLLLR